MAPEKAPAFQFYPKDFLTDRRVLRMPMAARGIYITLLCHAWMDGALPNDLGELALILGIPEKTVASQWPFVLPCFTERDGSLYQNRIEEEREKQAAYRAKFSKRASDGAAKRWSKHASRMLEASDKQPTSIDSADAQASNKHDSSSSSSSSDNPQPPVGAVVPDMPDSLLVDAALAAKAARLFEGWPEVYAKARSGAWPRKAESRDWPNALDLVHAYPDVDRLLKMARRLEREGGSGHRRTIPGPA